jgi:hypothetical protein
MIMKVYVNRRAIEVWTGMTVRHALLRAGIFGEALTGSKVSDEWENELGFDGALTEGMRITVSEAEKGDRPA